MKLQLLVPQYEETDEVVKPLLDSIAIQQNIDFNNIGVIICNDGSDVFLSDELLSAYPFKIEYHKEPHRGVSGTRDACFNYSTADYVMFCDADDMFCHVCGLFIILREMDNGIDGLTSVFLEEIRTDKAGTESIIYGYRENDITFVHGKVYRRSYLIDNNLRWNHSLTVHEDSYFNVLCLSFSEKIRYYPVPYYLWKWRSNSVCRRDPLYMLKTMKNFIASSEALIGELLNRGKEDAAINQCGRIIFEAYYNMNKPEWMDSSNKQYRDITERQFAKLFNQYEYLWEKLQDNDRMSLSMGVRFRTINEGMPMESITLDDWLKHIKKLV